MIRPALVTDAPGIAQVHVDAWRETYAGIIPAPYLASLNTVERAQRWERQLTAGRHCVFVTEIQGEIVGFAAAGLPQQPELGFSSELQAIYLLKRAQGNGLGKALFERIAEAMHSRGHPDLYCWVVRENPAAAFYRKMGGELRQAKIAEIGGAPITEDLFLWRLFPTRAKS
ncbi:MAG: N-acetyltransferase family protein [Bdellovibrionota bacterium]